MDHYLQQFTAPSNYKMFGCSLWDSGYDICAVLVQTHNWLQLGSYHLATQLPSESLSSTGVLPLTIEQIFMIIQLNCFFSEFLLSSYHGRLLTPEKQPQPKWPNFGMSLACLWHVFGIGLVTRILMFIKFDGQHYYGSCWLDQTILIPVICWCNIFAVSVLVPMDPNTLRYISPKCLNSPVILPATAATARPSHGKVSSCLQVALRRSGGWHLFLVRLGLEGTQVTQVFLNAPQAMTCLGRKCRGTMIDQPMDECCWWQKPWKTDFIRFLICLSERLFEPRAEGRPSKRKRCLSAWWCGYSPRIPTTTWCTPSQVGKLSDNPEYQVGQILKL